MKNFKKIGLLVGFAVTVQHCQATENNTVMLHSATQEERTSYATTLAALDLTSGISCIGAAATWAAKGSLSLSSTLGLSGTLATVGALCAGTSWYLNKKYQSTLDKESLDSIDCRYDSKLFGICMSLPGIAILPIFAAYLGVFGAYVGSTTTGPALIKAIMALGISKNSAALTTLFAHCTIPALIKALSTNSIEKRGRTPVNDDIMNFIGTTCLTAGLLGLITGSVAGIPLSIALPIPC